MYSLFGLIDHKQALTTKEKNRILNMLARECEGRGTNATGIAYHFGGRLRIIKRLLPAHKRLCVQEIDLRANRNVNTDSVN